MNELCTLLSSVRSGETVTLEPGRIYHVRQDDSFDLSGYFCSNSARQNENPDGHRYSAIHLKDKKDVVIDGNGATVLVHGKMTPSCWIIARTSPSGISSSTTLVRR